ncbi:purine and uridine phosphorylase [Aspergillus ibericus CBS 121593]|uniref:Purine and uridine phosphorylase n=1 Tax=Aspergillus ibericus CBS 121593 TaxID=1448316 RepID=A0A395H954_9EURO|nr:purine and uridine phosphorylase [Aspergillus ibericus CBS 121593]RAL04481.1 purine and uridine phosphorylase [Aspergillus ibericus CBS 121593]
MNKQKPTTNTNLQATNPPLYLSNYTPLHKMNISPHPNPSYTLAYITALPHELTTAITLLDVLHGIPQSQPAEDNNAYILGRIGNHNVVMTCLPAGRMGIGAAATVGEGLRRTFAGVRWGVLVGVGGGVSCFHSGEGGRKGGKEVRLGDVVVGVPGGGWGGVVQYDLGNGEGQLNAPPEKLLGYVTMVNCLMRNPKVERNCLEEILGELGEEYAYPGHVEDRLFCSGEKRESTLPVVHVGTIASGNTVIGDGVTRDRICSRYKGSILCFEMEAAGLVNTLPCLVIRGISDYADVHKNDEWRLRAVAAAASYAKALILHIPPEEVPHQEVGQVTELVKEIKELRGELTHIKATLENGLSSISYSLWNLQGSKYKVWKEFFQWLLPYGFGKQQRRLKEN